MTPNLARINNTNLLSPEESAMLEVRTADKMNSEELEMVRRALLDDLGEVEAWTAIGTNKKLAYSTHGIIRFFGKFPPPISSYLIEKYTNIGELVLDPMSGSGTTGVECLLRNRTCELRDINPLMLLLASVKTTRINKADILNCFTQIKNNYKPVDFNKNKNSYEGLKDPQHWFLKETMDSLNGLKILIDKIEPLDLKNFFTACFSGIIRRVSRATSQQGRLFLDVETAEKDAFSFFENKVMSAMKAVDELPKKASINIQAGNLLSSTNILKKKADLIILHPPYFNSYKYSSVNSLELFWLGINHASIRKDEVREFFKVGKPENHEKFVEDMALGLNNAYKSLKVGGHLGFMMGDTCIRGEYIPVIRKTLDAAKLPNCSIATVALRVPKYTEASWATSQRRKAGSVGIKIYDFVIVLKKNA